MLPLAEGGACPQALCCCCHLLRGSSTLALSCPAHGVQLIRTDLWAVLLAALPSVAAVSAAESCCEKCRRMCDVNHAATSAGDHPAGTAVAAALPLLLMLLLM